MSKGRNTAGSGGRIRKSLAGRGPTPKAEDRIYHKAHQVKQATERRAAHQPQRAKAVGEWVVGRNPVLEALLAGVPVKTAYIGEGADRDDRLREILRFAATHSIPMLQATRSELDRLTGGAVHQSVALLLPGYEYAELTDVIEAAQDGGIVVACDHITDPHNLGAIIRSAAAFGAAGVVIPNRRSAKMTAAAWKASAGAAARLPVVQVVNLNQALEQFSRDGFTILGLAGEAGELIDQVHPDQPVVLVVGSEGEGLSRLVREHCDTLIRIPIAGEVESLNASVATSIGLYELTRA
ncbi:MAG: 23S rRNA (guanosine(2251)-2'-O)-methyltransferase RlmB [Propionibacteriaceae bacterium]|jgi:23S rRNA (guanosine2251-2'-O)-methyltransferase|nr:23S rRNA (guanosine(2251)-2'-O)-methyltransferase RlmB [Propionibacteriaceae bacterium]